MRISFERYPFLTHPGWALLLSVLVCLPLWHQGRSLTINSDSRTLMEGDQRNLQTYEKVDQILEKTTVVVISLDDPNLFTNEGLARVRNISRNLESLNGLDDVKSLTHSYKPVRKGLSFDMVTFVPEGRLDEEELTRLKDYATTHPLVRNIMVGAEGRNTIITATFRRPVNTPEEQRLLKDEVVQAIEAVAHRAVDYKVVALPFIEEEIRSTIRRDVQRTIPILAVLVLIAVAAALRKPVHVAITFLNVVLAMSLIPGTLNLMGLELNFYTLMVFPLIGGLQLTLSLHLLTRLDGRRSLPLAVSEIWRSSAYATVTTFIGLGSLTLCEVRQVGEFGWMGALSILVVFLWTFGPGLSLTALLYHPSTKDENSGSPPVEMEVPAAISRYIAWIQRHRSGILIGSLLLLMVAALGLRSIRTDIRIVEFLDHSSPTRQALEEFDQVYGGINIVQLEFDTGKPDGVNNLAFLKDLQAIQDHAESFPEVTSTYSFAQLIAMMNQIWEREKEGSLRLPESRFTLGIFLVALKATDYPFLRALSDENNRTGYLIVRTRDMPSERYLEIIRQIEDYANKHKSEGVTVTAAKGIHSILEADRRIMKAQTDSVAFTLGAVGIVLALLWLSVPNAAIALFANVIPVAAVMSLAGFTQVPLNSVTVMVAAIVLGIVIDDTVHLMTWWRKERTLGKDPQSALESTLTAKIRPIICTSIVLILVLGSFQISSFPPVRHFGILSSAAFVGALFSVLVLVPALLLVREKKEKDAHEDVLS